MRFYGIWFGQEGEYTNPDSDRTTGRGFAIRNTFEDWGTGGESIAVGNTESVLVEGNHWIGSGKTVLITEYRGVSMPPSGSTSAIVGPKHPHEVVFQDNSVEGAWSHVELNGRGV